MKYRLPACKSQFGGKFWTLESTPKLYTTIPQEKHLILPATFKSARPKRKLLLHVLKSKLCDCPSKHCLGWTWKWKLMPPNIAESHDVLDKNKNLKQCFAPDKLWLESNSLLKASNFATAPPNPTTTTRASVKKQNQMWANPMTCIGN